MAILSPLSVSSSGYLTTGSVRSLAVVSDGYLANIVVVDGGDKPISGGGTGGMPGGRYYSRSYSAPAYIDPNHKKRLMLEDDDMLTLFMLATMFQLFEDD